MATARLTVLRSDSTEPAALPQSWKTTCRAAPDYKCAATHANRKQPPGWPKKVDTQEACCAACAAEPNCAAAVFGSPPGPGALCWFKDEGDTKHKGVPLRGKQTMGCTLKDAGEDDVPDEFSFGFEFLLLGGGAVYAVGGIILGQRRGSERGVKAHPHYAKVVALGGLVLDGIAFTRAGGRRPPQQSRGGTKGRESKRSLLMDAEVGRASGGQKESRSPSGGGGSTKDKENKPSKTKGKRRGSSKKTKEEKARRSADRSSGAEDEEGGGAPQSSGAPAPATSTSAASAGGGRWVHVSL
jgi:hypothetical protein